MTVVNKVKIRKVTIKDFEEIFLLLKQLWPEKKLKKKRLFPVLSRAVRSKCDYYFCAEINKKIIGFCSLSVRNSFFADGYIGYIGELVVDKSFRGNGVGSKLLKTAIDEVKKRGCSVIELDSAFHRKEAHKFYLKNGFTNKGYIFSKNI